MQSCGYVLRNDKVVCLHKVLLVTVHVLILITSHIAIIVNIVIYFNFVPIMLSIFYSCMLHNRFQMQIRDAGKDETALAVHWVMDSVYRCQVGSIATNIMVSWHIWWMFTVQQMITTTGNRKFPKNMALQKQSWFQSVMQQKKQRKHYSMQHHHEKTQKRNNVRKETISRNKENAACMIMLF